MSTNCPRQFGWTRDPRITPLEPGHVLVEFDDREGVYYEIHSKENAKTIEEYRDTLWKEIVDTWANE